MGAITSSLANALNLLSLSLSTVQSIEVSESANQQKDVDDYSNSDINDEEDSLNELRNDCELLGSFIGNGFSSGMLLRNFFYINGIFKFKKINYSFKNLNLIRQTIILLSTLVCWKL